MRKLLSILLSLCLILAIFSLPIAALGGEFPPPDSSDLIHYINVNTEVTNDAILIESDGMTMLVDTSNPDAATGGLAAVENDTANVNEVIRYLDHCGISELDYVVLTHNHSDHIGGVERLCEEGYIGSSTTVYYRTTELTEDVFLYPEWDSEHYIDACYSALENSDADLVCLRDEGITALTLDVGNFSVEFLNLDTDHDGVVDFDSELENNNSIVLKVTKGNVDTLLTGDIEAEAEYRMLDELSSVEVLKVPHHGVRTSSSYEFMSTVRPETAILTANGYWQYGANEYLMRMGSTVYALGDCPALAIVEAVGYDWYEIRDAFPYFRPSSDGWHNWLDHWYYIRHGRFLEGGWHEIDGEMYYFNDDGIVLTGEQEIDGETYVFSDFSEYISE